MFRYSASLRIATFLAILFVGILVLSACGGAGPQASGSQASALQASAPAPAKAALTGVEVPGTPWRLHVLNLWTGDAATLKVPDGWTLRDGWKWVVVQLGVENTSPNEWGAFTLASEPEDKGVFVIDSQGFEHKVWFNDDRQPHVYPPTATIPLILVADIPNAYDAVSLKVGTAYSDIPNYTPVSHYELYGGYDPKPLPSPILLDLKKIEKLPLPFVQLPEQFMGQEGDSFTFERNRTVTVKGLRLAGSRVAASFDISNVGGEDIREPLSIFAVALDENGNYWWSNQWQRWGYEDATGFKDVIAPGETTSGTVSLVEVGPGVKKVWLILDIVGGPENSSMQRKLYELASN